MGVIVYLLVIAGYFVAPYSYFVARSVWTDGVNDTCWGNAADSRIDDMIQDCRFGDARNALQRSHSQGHSYEFSEHNLSYRSFGEFPFFKDNDDAVWRRSTLEKINTADDAHKEKMRLKALAESVVAAGTGGVNEVVGLEWSALCEADEKKLVSGEMLSKVRVAWFTNRDEVLKGSPLLSIDRYFDDMPTTEIARDTLSAIIVGKLSSSQELDLEELLAYLIICNQKARPDAVQKSVVDRIVREIRSIGARDGRQCGKVFCNLFEKNLVKDHHLVNEICATMLRYNREGLIELAARNHEIAGGRVDEYLLNIDLEDDEIWDLSERASDKMRLGYSRKAKHRGTLVRLAGKYDDVLASLENQQDLKEVVLMAQKSHVETLSNAISHITNQQMLRELYRAFATNRVDVSLCILEEISSEDNNQEFLVEIVKADKDGRVSSIAYPKLTKNSQSVVELYKNREGYALHKTDWDAFLKFLYNANSNVVEIVIDSFGSERAVVSRIAQTATMCNVKLAAISKCSDQDILRNLASHSLDATIRGAARERIKDRQVVEDICARDDRIRSQVRVASQLANFIETYSNLKYARECGATIWKSQMDAVKHAFMPSVESLGLFRVEVTDCSKSRMFEYPVMCDGSEKVFIMRPPCDKKHFKKGDIAYVRGRIKLIDVDHGKNMVAIWVEECVTEDEYQYAMSL